MCGTSVKTIQRRLLVEPALTFEKALDTALAAEAADKDSKRLTGDTLNGAPELETAVNKPQPDNGTRTKRVSPPAIVSECYRCGGAHSPTEPLSTSTVNTYSWRLPLFQWLGRERSTSSRKGSRLWN